MLCFLFVPAFDYKIYCLMLYHLLKSTLHLKANACSIGTFIRFYMQSSLHSKANACNIGTFIRFYIQMRVQIKNKAFAYRFYRPFTQQCVKKNGRQSKPRMVVFQWNHRKKNWSDRWSTVPLGDWLEKKKVPAIIIKQQFGFPMSTT